jgi:uncharacterized protein YndB with AHSA1/START domain
MMKERHMTTSKTTTSRQGNDLVLERVIDAPPARVFQAWTDGTLLPKWFAPRPWTTAKVNMDVRHGGSTFALLRGPDGTEVPCPGVILEVIPNRRLVFTDAFTKAWEPSEKPFMTTILDFEDLGDGRTKYTARCRHWNAADVETHEQMGFHQGWAICAEQLAELVEGRDEAQAA